MWKIALRASKTGSDNPDVHTKSWEQSSGFEKIRTRLVDGHAGYVSDKDKTGVKISFDISIGISKIWNHLLGSKMQKKELIVEGAVSVYVWTDWTLKSLENTQENESRELAFCCMLFCFWHVLQAHTWHTVDAKYILIE